MTGPGVDTKPSNAARVSSGVWPMPPPPRSITKYAAIHAMIMM